ncbi:MAG: hypothetical protein KAR19_12815 [Bacteroidales bacterium]|nr:hypothetical protein [Bacteroidales bacterium]
MNVDFPGATESLQMALEKDSLDAEVHFFLGASLANTTQKAKAMVHLDKSLELMNPDPAVISRIYSEQGNIMDNSMHRSKEALVDYQRFIDHLNRLPESDRKNQQLPTIRGIVEDRIESLKEELFFLDQQ